MIIASTITLVVYLCYLVTQHILFTSCNFETHIPWASLERDVSLIKVFLRLVLSFGFIFDKVGNSKPEVGLVCFFLCGIITLKRLTSAFFFRKSISQANLVYDFIMTIFFLCTSISSYFNEPFTTISITLLFLLSIFFAAMLHILGERRLMREPMVMSGK